MYTYVKGGNGFTLQVQCLDSAQAEITDIVFGVLSVRRGYVLTTEKNMTKVVGQPHQLEYTFSEAEIPDAGKYGATVKIKRATGVVVVSPNKFEFAIANG